ncbi:MAG: rhomboid family intramembrane serine protease [Candidatus Micrarchaeota archaeon]
MRITEILIMACIFVFIGQLGVPGLEGNIILKPVGLLQEPWLIFTSMFAHGDLQHLFFNMFALFIFGGALERTIGKGNFLLLYLVSGAVGAIGFMLLSTPFSSALGASGAIYGLIGALVLILPKMRIYLMGVPMPMYVAGFVYVAIELLGLGAMDGIAHSAHLLGLFGGLGVAFWVRDRFDDLGVSKAAAVGIAFSLLTGVGFGYYYNMGEGGELNAKIAACEERELVIVADVQDLLYCLDGLAEEYKNEPAKKGIVCREEARFARYVVDYSTSEIYDICMQDD